MVDESDLHDYINQLPHKKPHVIDEGALKAKENLNYLSESDIDDEFDDELTSSSISEFRKSVFLLGKIFEKSRFDELALFIAEPTRILVLNLLIGFLRGVGFFLGIVFVCGLISYFIFDGLDPSLKRQVLEYLWF